MDAVGTFVHPPCRGGACPTVFACAKAATCLYKSSSEERTASLSLTTGPCAPTEVKDFSGVADGGGIKSVMFDPTKTALQLIDPRFVEGLGAVLAFGAKKYAPNNWMRGMSWITVLGGILRHVFAFARGEEQDKESGLPHLHHAACGLMFLSYYAHSNRTAHKPFDDRVFF